MHSSYIYPQNSLVTDKVVDLSDRAERKRLSHSALAGFFKLASVWQLREEEARELLGGLSASTFYEWKKKQERVLEVDRITRISYLLGIYKSLHIIYDDELADEWIKLPNTNSLFGGRTPLSMMMAGGILAMQTVRRLLDARRGGL